MKFTKYQYNNIISLITYLEDCINYDQSKEDYRLLYDSIEILKKLVYKEVKESN